MQVSGGEAGSLDDVIRAESTLARWEDGLALFRVRVTRADGAAAEAHGAAHDGESEAFWQLAEDRALARARDLLQQIPPVPPGAIRPAGALPESQRQAAAAPPTRTTSGPQPPPSQTSPQHAPAARPPASGTPGARPPAVPPSRQAAPPTAAGGAPRTSAPQAVDASAGAVPAKPKPTGAPPGAAKPETGSAESPIVPEDEIPDPFLPDDDPFEDVDPRVNGASPPGVVSDAEPPADVRRPAMRQAPGGGVPPSQQRVSPARTTPAPNPQRCSFPGCSVPLTPAQVTHSMHHHGQPLCPTHARKE